MTGSTWTEGEGVSREVKAAVYNRFLPSMGGGERHSCMLAQVLAEEGHEVELVTHEDVGKDLLADHLGLNLAKVSLRVVPDRGDRDMASLSADYELFVNASYMSRVKARAAHNVYLCYFPTPFDHDLSGWRRWMVRRIGPYVRDGNGGPSGWGRGWFPPEGGRRRSWIWTSGHAGLLIVGGGERVLGFDLGRPGAPDAAELAVRDERGRELARLVAGPERFQTEHITLPASARDKEIFFDSDTFVPGRGDDRTLGVAVSRLRMGGQRRTAAEWMGERLPWLNRNPRDLSFLDSYQRVIANSEYTRGWIRRYWGVDSSVLFPPIRAHELKPGPKERKILSVGRFFARGMGHSKKQLELVEAFGRMMRRSPLEGWELHLVRKDLKVKYKNSALGFLWSLANPLLYLVVFDLVFSVFLKSNVPYFAVMFMSGLLVWNFFNLSTLSATGVVVGSANLVRKVRFPRVVLPLASVGFATVHFVLQMLVLFVFLLVFYRAFIGAQLLLLVPALAVVIVLTVAMALLVSSLNVRYRDTEHLLEITLLAWFWLTPIVYPVSRVQGELVPRHLFWVFMANPMTAVVTSMQRAIYRFPVVVSGGQPVKVLATGGYAFYLKWLAVAGLLSLVLLVAGLVVFGRMQADFAEEL